MHRDRVERFFTEIQARRPFEDFHVQFFLDAHGQGGVTHYLVYANRYKYVRWFTVDRRRRHVVDPSGASQLCEEGDVLCLKKDRSGLFARATEEDTTHAARERWTNLSRQILSDATLTTSSSDICRERPIVYNI